MRKFAGICSSFHFADAYLRILIIKAITMANINPKNAIAI